MQHVIAGLGQHVYITRREFETLCRGAPDAAGNYEHDAAGNYEYAALARNLMKFACRMEPVTPDIVETLTVCDEMDRWTSLFATGTLEGSMVLGYLVHVPGHWISVVPHGFDLGLVPAKHVGTICDSLYDCVFRVTGAEFADFLEAVAIHSVEHGASGEWSAYRVYLDAHPSA